MNDAEIIAILRRNRVPRTNAVSRDGVRLDVGKDALAEIDEWVRSHGGSQRPGAPQKGMKGLDERDGRPGRSIRYDRYAIPASLLGGD